MNDIPSGYTPKFEGRLKKKMDWREMLVGAVLLLALVFLLSLIWDLGSVSNYVKNG